jgi:predicted phage-related endonuclease
MVDLHTYRSYRVVRNNDLIGQMIPKLVELWRRIETRQAPEPDFGHSGTLDLLKKLHQPSDEIVQFDDVVASAWARRQQLKESIKLLDAEADAIDAKVLYGLGTASVGRLPLGQREISVCTVKDSLWVPEDIDKAVESQGKVKRRGHVRLLERKAQGPKGRKGSVA